MSQVVQWLLHDYEIGVDGSVGAGKKAYTQHVEAHTLISSHYVSECTLLSSVL